ncbi:ankyrin repeat-containing domain protein [Lactifluus subvellereus]|nr:ankyrin repeat-containing domain protein [Lactifluus subvellereus]
MASEMGYVEVTRILPQHGVDADAQDDSDWTPLNVALRRGYLEIVQVLLDRSVDANVWDNNNWSPLHVALHERYCEVARVLELSPNVNVLSKDWPAPMYILDGIDAALNLSHTQHIGTLFRGAQFIVVSLKEGLFTNANVLFRTRFRDGTSVIKRTAQRGASALYGNNAEREEGAARGEVAGAGAVGAPQRRAARSRGIATVAA